MARTAADVLADRLIDWGVRVIFGLPGDGINGIMEALRVRQERFGIHSGPPRGIRGVHGLRLCQVPTGQLGVCLATSGPGAIHLLNGLYDAKLDGAPVLALTGQTYHDLIGTHYQQEVDLLSALQGCRRLTTSRFWAPGHVRALVDAGCRAALSQRGVAHITNPVDLQDQLVGDDTKSAKQVEGHTSDAWRP